MKYFLFMWVLMWIVPVWAQEFSFERKPFVSPYAVRLLVEGIPNDVPIIQVDVKTLEDRNGYNPITMRLNATNGRNVVAVREKTESISYEIVGKINPDIFVLLTRGSRGGTGVDTNLLFVKMGYRQFLTIEEENDFIRFEKPIQTIERVGLIFLGDRWVGETKLDDDLLTIGADGNTYGNRRGMPSKIYRIDLK